MSFKSESVYPLPTQKHSHEITADEIKTAVEYYQAQHAGIEPYFLGPQAENHEFFKEYINQILDEHNAARERYHGINDPIGGNDDLFITPAIKEYETCSWITRSLFFNPRYQAHMCMDTSMPAILGYITTMIFNTNNVSLEASPVTTLLELEAGKQPCKMLGYRLEASEELSSFSSEVEPELKPGERVSWGHITCGGTVANLEAVWAARNLKFYPLSLRSAMAPGEPLEFITSSFKITTCQEPGNPKLFASSSPWELLNLTVDTILEIPDRLYQQYGISAVYLEATMKKHDIQSCGKDVIERQYNIKPMKLLVSNMNHYSWPKVCAITGIGSSNMIGVKVDNEAALDLSHLKETLEEHLKNEQGIYCVIAIVGSTEEGTVDYLRGILQLRSDFQKRGLSFVVHVDAAWGGYFASVVPRSEPDGIETVPSLRLRGHVEDTFRNIRWADSVTIDPHKSGYVSYPAGALCYRDGRMRYLVTWTSPYIAREHQPESIGAFGVEGSKLGASPVAAYLSNSIISMRETGYGALLREALFSSSRISARWVAMSTDNDKFMVVPFNPLPSERDPNHSKADVDAEKKFIRERILPVENIDLLSDLKALHLLQYLDSDISINLCSVNFKLSNSEWNTDVEEANYLNKRIVKRMSYVDPNQKLKDIDLFLTSTELEQNVCKDCATNYKRRLGLKGEANLFVIRNVVMSPFLTAGNFVAKLAGLRNPIDPASHRFVVQGTPYQPFFREADCQAQLIISADVGKDSMDAYLHARARATKYIVKNRGLKYLGSQYPKGFMPFYMYGTAEPDDQHISHMLLKAPNANLCADNISVTLDQPLSRLESHLKNGCIAYATNTFESSRQPFSQTASNLEHSSDTEASVPGLLENIDLGNPLAKGTMTLNGTVYVDAKHINEDGLEGLLWDGSGWSVLPPL
ncbi:pyridoxal phosphate-dependent transferase [Trichophaea hybrida]|nr:pyridoxal phosphate-dependent transferase [Trichophaea hybrida]